MKITKEHFLTGPAIVILIAIISVVFFHPWTDLYSDSLISWDKLGYYLYLPTLFIYKDWHNFSFLSEYFHSYQPGQIWYQTLILPDGKQVITYQLGVSFFQLPFFLMGHLSAKIFHFPQDGFSKPYVIWIYFSGLFYTILGLFFSFKTLCKFFTIKISSLIVILILLSTNLYYYGFVDNIMPHSYSFFLLSVLLYYTIRWHEKQTLISTIIICLSIGFLLSIRMTDGVAIIIPILFGITDKESFRSKINLLKDNAGKLLISAFIGMIPFFIQLYYWHFATGHWFFNAYTYTYLGFDWTNPHLKDFLISFRKGWFVYTPVMIITIIGFFSLKNSKLKILLPGIISFFVINVYIFSSWSSWWFGGSFGQRSMVQSYALLIIPFASGITTLTKNKLNKLILFSFLTGCIVLNLLFTWIYKNSLMLSDGMTRAMFKEVLLHPFSAYIPESKRIDNMHWKDEWIQSTVIISQDSSVRTLHIQNFSNILEMNGDNVKHSSYKWIRCTFETQFQPKDNINPNNIHLVNEIQTMDPKYSAHPIRFWKGKSFTDQFSDKNKMSDWVLRTIDLRIPVSLYGNDKFLLYFWLTEDQIVHVRNVQVAGLILKN